MLDSLTIPHRFRGPPASGNGGYVAGAIAEQFPAVALRAADAAVQVTLRAPIPLEVPMRLTCSAENQLTMTLDDRLIAEAEPARLDLDVPEPPSFGMALAARDESPAFTPGMNSLMTDGVGFHPVCACCGAEVAEGEGLRVFAAPVPGFRGAAAAWQPHPEFADHTGVLPERLVWTALDCPGQFAWLTTGIRTGMLGRMTARVFRPVPVGADYVVIGWPIDVERRKHFAGTALFDADGNLCALAHQTWIGRMN